MTVEHRLHFGLADILAITCECKSCGLRVSMSPSKLAISSIRRCTSCGHEWLDEDRTNGAMYTHPMTWLLTAIPHALKNEESPGFRLILEFAEAKA